MDLFSRTGDGLPTQSAKRRKVAPRAKPPAPEPSPLARGAALEGLDEEQLAAATTEAKRSVVIAGPGAGKTRTLVGRLAHLVEKGVDPRHVWVVTFTNKASEEIRDRVARFMGRDVAKAMRIGTFHSLSARLLRRYPDKAGLSRGFQILDEDDAARVMREAVTGTGIAGPGDASDEDHVRRVGEVAARATRRISMFKAWGLTDADVLDPGRPRRSAEDEMFGRIYVAYQEELRRRDRVDFGDLVLRWTTLLQRDEDLRERVSSDVRYLLVDEAQDGNPVQVEWVRMMSYRHRSVMAVGDEDQSIFSFQAGCPDAIYGMGTSQAVVHTLTRSRRCTREVLEPAVALVGRNRRTTPKTLVSDASGEPPTLKLCSNDLEEATYVAKRCKELIAGGAALSEVAILFRSAWLMKPVEEALIKAGVPHHVVGGHALGNRSDVRDVRAYMQLALKGSDDLAFGRVFNRPPRGLGAAACMFVSERMAKGDSCVDALGLTHEEGEDRRPLPETWTTGFRQLGGQLALMTQIAHTDTDPEGRDVSAELLLEHVLSDGGIGFEAMVRQTKDRKELRARLDLLAALRRIARESDGVQDFVDRIALAGDRDGQLADDAVTLTTMHSAKGLEWDHVICPAFDSAAIPSPRALEDPVRGTWGDKWNGPSSGGMEEERRLAYVAFTRARRTLTVSTRMSRNGKPNDPSVFLAESRLERILSVDAYERSRMTPVGRTKAGERQGRTGFARRS